MRLTRLLIPPLLTACLAGCLAPRGVVASYNSLAHATAYGTHWSKDGVSLERRHTQWAACGGFDIGGLPPLRDNATALEKEEFLTQLPKFLRMFDKPQRCMRRNGYRYTGKCHDNEIYRSVPACGAP